MKCWASLLTVNLERCSTVHLSKKSESFSNINMNSTGENLNTMTGMKY